MAKAGAPSKVEAKIVQDIVGRLQTKIQLLAEEDKLTSIIKGTNNSILLMSEELLLKSGKKLRVDKDIARQALRALDAQDRITEELAQQFSGVVKLYQSYQDIKDVFSGLVSTGAKFAAGIGIALLAAIKFQKAIADTRKELGVSVSTAAKLNTQNKILGLAAKAYGLDVEDIKNAQTAIRKDLGASVQESVKLSLSFARTAAATGQTSEELSGTLSIMESISGASREVLLNQIRTNAAMIEAAGVAPALVMKDIAENSEFFASFAKQGGQNLIGAGIAARKLGLDMSAVKGITESLLDFETSIEASQTASLLLGRQINTDKARQLAFSGDQEGLMKEITRLAGSEAEFTKMNAFQRDALAKSLGLSTEALARTVRNNTAGATGAAAGSAAARGQSTQSSDTRTHELLGKLVRIMD